MSVGLKSISKKRSHGSFVGYNIMDVSVKSMVEYNRVIHPENLVIPGKDDKMTFGLFVESMSIRPMDINEDSTIEESFFIINENPVLRKDDVHGIPLSYYIDGDLKTLKEGKLYFGKLYSDLIRNSRSIDRTSKALRSRGKRTNYLIEGELLFDEEIINFSSSDIDKYINDDRIPFQNAYTIAGMLIGYEPWISK